MNLSAEAVTEFRQMRLQFVEDSLADMSHLYKQSGCSPEHILLLRKEMLDRKKEIIEQIETSAPLSREEIALLETIQEENQDDYEDGNY